MLSDVVVCGPASVCLVKPAVLSLSHCADNIDHHWSLTVIYRPLQASDVTASAVTWQAGNVLCFFLKYTYFDISNELTPQSLLFSTKTDKICNFLSLYLISRQPMSSSLIIFIVQSKLDYCN